LKRTVSAAAFHGLKSTDLLPNFAAQVFQCLPIAEGYGKGSRKEYVQFLCIAQGSLKEWETQVILAERLHYRSKAAADDLLELSEEVGRMLGALIRSLRMKTA
jgi:hypothetical protein